MRNKVSRKSADGLTSLPIASSRAAPKSLRFTAFNDLGALPVLKQVPRVHPLRCLKRSPADEQIGSPRQNLITAVRADHFEGAVVVVHPALTEALLRARLPCRIVLGSRHGFEHVIAVPRGDIVEADRANTFKSASSSLARRAYGNALDPFVGYRYTGLYRQRR